MKRVIITSSGGAIFHFPVEPGYTFTEKDWNTTSSLTNGPYFYSKKVAEEAAWKLYEKHKDDIDMVVVNPLYVVGPSKNAILNTRYEIVSRLTIKLGRIEEVFNRRTKCDSTWVHWYCSRQRCCHLPPDCLRKS